MAINDAQRREMILKGNLMKTIIRICLPLAIYQFFNSCYTLLDQIICAYISTDAQNAVSSISQIKGAISAFGAGLAAGGGVLVSRFYGAGNVKEARHSSSNLFFLSIIVSALLMIILIPLAVPIMKWCQIAPNSIKIGSGYFQLQLLELAFVSLNSVFIALEKAKGNSKIIFKLNILVLAVKLAFTCLFIFGLKLDDIIYVELATIIGQISLTGIGLFYMFRKKNIIRLSFKMLLPKKDYVVPILKLSIPIFLGKFVMSMGKVVVNGICGAYWNEGNVDPLMDGLIVGTLGVSNNMCGLITSPTNTFEEGESSIVSQNIGNKNLKRAVKTFSKTLLLSTIVSLIGYVLMRFVFVDMLTELFTLTRQIKINRAGLSPDEIAAELHQLEVYKKMIREIFVWDSLSIPALGVNAAVLGLLYGFGKTSLSMILNLSRIGSRILILVLLHTINPSLAPTLCAGLSMGISNIIILILSFVFLFIFLIQLRKKGFKGMRLSDPEPEVSELVLDEE